MDYHTIPLHDLPYEEVQTLIGFRDENLEAIARVLGKPIYFRDQSLKTQLEGKELEQLVRIIEHALVQIRQEGMLEKEELGRIIQQARREKLQQLYQPGDQPIIRTKTGQAIYPKSLNQKELINSFNDKDITFALGVAGTGKTYLAVAYAASLLKKQKISKIILTRPAVEAGESLGFLPGDMKEKVDPYLRPLYDALDDFFGAENVEKMIERNVIEIAPLAFMRGRTLNQAVVILDEAQNTTKSQMKMFLTRLGKNCKMIINGDITQTDLVARNQSGLLDAWTLLEGIEEIGRVELDESDVMRNPVVQKIIRKYDEAGR